MHTASRTLDTICEGEVVTAREVSSPNRPIDNPVKKNPPSKQALSHLAESGEPCRIQIRLVTAQLARDYVRGTLKDNPTATNNVFAFDGAFISGNTSLVTILVASRARTSLTPFFFRQHFDTKPLMHLVGFQKMI